LAGRNSKSTPRFGGKKFKIRHPPGRPSANAIRGHKYATGDVAPPDIMAMINDHMLS
jgi:hypothetical protein